MKRSLSVKRSPVVKRSPFVNRLWSIRPYASFRNKCCPARPRRHRRRRLCWRRRCGVASFGPDLGAPPQPLSENCSCPFQKNGFQWANQKVEAKPTRETQSCLSSSQTRLQRRSHSISHSPSNASTLVSRSHVFLECSNLSDGLDSPSSTI